MTSVCLSVRLPARMCVYFIVLVCIVLFSFIGYYLHGHTV